MDDLSGAGHLDSPDGETDAVKYKPKEIWVFVFILFAVIIIVIIVCVVLLWCKLRQWQRRQRHSGYEESSLNTERESFYGSILIVAPPDSVKYNPITDSVSLPLNSDSVSLQNLNGPDNGDDELVTDDTERLIPESPDFKDIKNSERKLYLVNGSGYVSHREEDRLVRCSDDEATARKGNNPPNEHSQGNLMGNASASNTKDSPTNKQKTSSPNGSVGKSPKGILLGASASSASNTPTDKLKRSSSGEKPRKKTVRFRRTDDLSNAKGSKGEKPDSPDVEGSLEENMAQSTPQAVQANTDRIPKVDSPDTSQAVGATGEDMPNKDKSTSVTIEGSEKSDSKETSPKKSLAVRIRGVLKRVFKRGESKERLLSDQEPDRSKAYGGTSSETRDSLSEGAQGGGSLFTELQSVTRNSSSQGAQGGESLFTELQNVPKPNESSNQGDEPPSEAVDTSRQEGTTSEQTDTSHNYEQIDKVSRENVASSETDHDSMYQERSRSECFGGARRKNTSANRQSTEVRRHSKPESRRHKKDVAIPHGEQATIPESDPDIEPLTINFPRQFPIPDIVIDPLPDDSVHWTASRDCTLVEPNSGIHNSVGEGFLSLPNPQLSGTTTMLSFVPVEDNIIGDNSNSGGNIPPEEISEPIDSGSPDYTRSSQPAYSFMDDASSSSGGSASPQLDLVVQISNPPSSDDKPTPGKPINISTESSKLFTRQSNSSEENSMSGESGGVPNLVRQVTDSVPESADEIGTEYPKPPVAFSMGSSSSVENSTGGESSSGLLTRQLSTSSETSSLPPPELNIIPPPLRFLRDANSPVENSTRGEDSCGPTFSRQSSYSSNSQLQALPECSELTFDSKLKPSGNFQQESELSVANSEKYMESELQKGVDEQSSLTNLNDPTPGSTTSSSQQSVGDSAYASNLDGHSSDKTSLQYSTGLKPPGTVESEDSSRASNVGSSNEQNISGHLPPTVERSDLEDLHPEGSTPPPLPPRTYPTKPKPTATSELNTEGQSPLKRDARPNTQNSSNQVRSESRTSLHRSPSSAIRSPTKPDGNSRVQTQHSDTQSSISGGTAHLRRTDVGTLIWATGSAEFEIPIIEIPITYKPNQCDSESQHEPTLPPDQFPSGSSVQSPSHVQSQGRSSSRIVSENRTGDMQRSMHAQYQPSRHDRYPQSPPQQSMAGLHGLSQSQLQYEHSGQYGPQEQLSLGHYARSPPHEQQSGHGHYAQYTSQQCQPTHGAYAQSPPNRQQSPYRHQAQYQQYQHGHYDSGQGPLQEQHHGHYALCRSHEQFPSGQYPQSPPGHYAPFPPQHQQAAHGHYAQLQHGYNVQPPGGWMQSPHWEPSPVRHSPQQSREVQSPFGLDFMDIPSHQQSQQGHTVRSPPQEQYYSQMAYDVQERPSSYRPSSVNQSLPHSYSAQSARQAQLHEGGVHDGQAGTGYHMQSQHGQSPPQIQSSERDIRSGQSVIGDRMQSQHGQLYVPSTRERNMHDRQLRTGYSMHSSSGQYVHSPPQVQSGHLHSPLEVASGHYLQSPPRMHSPQDHLAHSPYRGHTPVGQSHLSIGNQPAIDQHYRLQAAHEEFPHGHVLRSPPQPSRQAQVPNLLQGQHEINIQQPVGQGVGTGIQLGLPLLPGATIQQSINQKEVSPSQTELILMNRNVANIPTVMENQQSQNLEVRSPPRINLQQPQITTKRKRSPSRSNTQLPAIPEEVRPAPIENDATPPEELKPSINDYVAIPSASSDKVRAAPIEDVATPPDISLEVTPAPIEDGATPPALPVEVRPGPTDGVTIPSAVTDEVKPSSIEDVATSERQPEERSQGSNNQFDPTPVSLDTPQSSNTQQEQSHVGDTAEIPQEDVATPEVQPDEISPLGANNHPEHTPHQVELPGRIDTQESTNMQQEQSPVGDTAQMSTASSGSPAESPKSNKSIGNGSIPGHSPAK